MTQTQKQDVPKLRSPGFEGAWILKTLGEECDVRDGTHDTPKYKNDGFPLITSKNLRPDGQLDLNNVDLISKYDFEAINRRSKVDTGDILFGMIGTIGNPVRVESDGFAIKNVALIKPKKSVLNEWLIHFLRGVAIARQFHYQNAGGTQKFLSLGIIRKLKVNLPTLPEQRKIAHFLGAVDEKIAHLSRKKALLEDYKKGCIQQLFSQKVRFKDDDGKDFPDWEEKRLGEVFSWVNTNSLSRERLTLEGGQVQNIHSHISQVT